jgi:hypothetical protein
MRAPSPSFKSELAAYRQRLVSERADYPQLRLWLKILDRWKDHSSAETIWKTVREKLLAAPTAGQFIDLVLERWSIAIELQRVTSQPPEKAGAKIRVQADRHWRDGDYWLAAYEKSFLESWTNDIRERSDRLLGRKKAGAARRCFMAGWRDKFKELTGQPLDPVVKVLTEIAFGCDVSIEAVRAAHMPAADITRDRVIRRSK